MASARERSGVVAIILLVFAQLAVAQQSYQAQARQSLSYGRLNQPQTLRPGKPIKFAGWNHVDTSVPSYREKFSRPRARIAQSTVSSASPFASSASQAALSSSAAMPGFLLRNSLPAGFLPTSVATGDFNGDGSVDFAMANGGDNNLWLYFGKGGGTFALPIILPITQGLTPVWVATADLRGTGKLDLLVADADSNTLSIFLGNGDGTFVESHVSLSFSPLVLTTGDFDHDGKMDVTIAGYSSVDQQDHFAMLPGHADGTFGTGITGNPGSYPTWVDTADLNGDGYLDLVFTHNINSVRVFINNGDGSFSAGQVLINYIPNDFIATAALADIDGDGKPDLLAAAAFGELRVYQGNGDGTFSTNPAVFGTGDVPYGIAVADINGDGHPEGLGLPAHGQL